MDDFKFDTIVIGGGHAGVEAAHILAKLKEKVLLISLGINDLASMPCNPSMGGPAKGIIIREVDALGGLIGKACDNNCLQARMLNTSKGPAVWALRMQIDKKTYSNYIKEELLKFKNLSIKEGVVSELIFDKKKIIGCVLNNQKYFSKSVILATGTYLNSKILIGSHTQATGPDGKKTSTGISNLLKEKGFDVIRLKTGTPPRLLSKTIDYSSINLQTDETNNRSFSSSTNTLDIKTNCHCYITKTTESTKTIINENIHLSPLYSGIIEGIGPRYCPSIEDKVMRFATKDTHQIFLEPETNEYILTYPQGLSSSLPRNVQRQVVNSVIGLEKTKIMKYGYAIEYDAINPLNIYPTLETKLIENFYTCGQINGTSGYEEAAGQGIVAGINAFLKNHNQKPLILKRHEAYIGVLIDDLTTKGTNEPYRMLTSRAEYRLTLRHDNAYYRLRDYALLIGSLTKKEIDKYNLDKLEVLNLTNLFNTTKVKGSEFNKYLDQDIQLDNNYSYLISEIIKRNQIPTSIIFKVLDLSKYNNTNIEHVIINIKYEDYIKKDREQIARIKTLESFQLGENFDYTKVLNLSSEAREKLIMIKPRDVAQASRIIGVNPSDISVLTIYLQSIIKRN